MYRCEGCKRVTEPGGKQNRVVIEKREKIYSFIDSVEASFGKKIYSSNDKNISKGWEIVKEIVVCGKCEKEENLN